MGDGGWGWEVEWVGGGIVVPGLVLPSGRELLSGNSQQASAL